MLERYFDGDWVRYMLVFIGGMAAGRFVTVWGEPAMDAIGLAAAAGLCVFVLGLRWLNRDA